MPENAWDLLIVVASVAVPATLAGVGSIIFIWRLANGIRGDVSIKLSGLRSDFRSDFQQLRADIEKEAAVERTAREAQGKETHERISRLQREHNDHRVEVTEKFVPIKAMERIEKRLDLLMTAVQKASGTE